jgi:catechol 2,3-dioxygenase-like lactoylglutathione lyase family enzyme
VTISKAVPNIKSDRPTETRDFFVDLLGLEVAMDIGWVVTVASPTNPSIQVTIVGNDDMAAPGISVGVPDVDAVHAKAVEQGREIVYPLRDEEWGVRRFMVGSAAVWSTDRMVSQFHPTGVMIPPAAA